MGRKSRLKKERREARQSENSTNKESVTMKDIKSRGIVIEGGSDNHAWGNTVVGFDEGVVIKDSPRSTANRNTVVSKESASIVTEINTFITSLSESIEQLNLPEDAVQVSAG